MLNGGEEFTKPDLLQAFKQLVLSQDSRDVLPIKTHKGLFRPAMLQQFEVHSASGILQSWKIELHISRFFSFIISNIVTN